MSLINQVLRDLDGRHAGQAPLPSGVRPLPRERMQAPDWRLALAGGALLLCAAAGWFAARSVPPGYVQVANLGTAFVARGEGTSTSSPFEHIEHIEHSGHIEHSEHIECDGHDDASCRTPADRRGGRHGGPRRHRHDNRSTSDSGPHCAGRGIRARSRSRSTGRRRPARAHGRPHRRGSPRAPCAEAHRQQHHQRSLAARHPDEPAARGVGGPLR